MAQECCGGQQSLEGEWPAPEIVTAAVTRGNKTWKVSVYDLPSLWQWVRQAQMQSPGFLQFLQGSAPSE